MRAIQSVSILATHHSAQKSRVPLSAAARVPVLELHTIIYSKSESITYAVTAEAGIDEVVPIAQALTRSYNSAPNELLSMPWVLGEWSVKSQSGLASLSGEMARQSAMIGYLNAFGLFTVTCAVAMPLILLVRRRRV